MLFDDRLATVLRHRAAGERSARTQYRQLLDLLGQARPSGDGGLVAAGWLRLAALGETLAPGTRADMIREPGVRFRNPELVLHLADDEAEVAAAALGTAQLSADDWDAVIPRLPIRARGFLRLRRDLPLETTELLERLGVRDRGLPRPQTIADPADEIPAAPLRAPRRPIPANDLAGPEPAPADAAAADGGEIGALVRRIAEFRRHRAAGPDRSDPAPQLPLGGDGGAGDRLSAGFAFTADPEGRIDWADAAVAPMIVGAVLPPAAHGRAAPIRGHAIDWTGAPAVSGAWIVDAAPRFSESGGRFIGYAGRFRRPPAADPADPASPAASTPDPAMGGMRILLHELKTPVNAIQGFAEVIQQQLFGPTPHEYRALAATIAGDAARLLAGFDELDRLARLETGAIELDEGESDLAAIVTELAGQLDRVLLPRDASFTLDLPAGPVPIALSHADAEAFAWRLLATIAGAAGPGERVTLSLDETAGPARLTIRLPATLAAQDDVFGADNRASGAVSAGMFGAGFALQLARAEARAIGGTLIRQGDALVTILPRLTREEAADSASGRGTVASG